MAGGAAFEQPGIDRVEQKVVSLSSSVVWMIVDHLYLQPGLLEEGGDAVWASEGSREEKQDGLGGMSRS
eukprot:3977091-Pleurochrysis_carterae.AAC.1